MRVFSCDEVDIISLRHVINEVEDLQYNQRNKNKKPEKKLKKIRLTILCDITDEI